MFGCIAGESGSEWNIRIRSIIFRAHALDKNEIFRQEFGHHDLRVFIAIFSYMFSFRRSDSRRFLSCALLRKVYLASRPEGWDFSRIIHKVDPFIINIQFLKKVFDTYKEDFPFRRRPIWSIPDAVWEFILFSHGTEMPDIHSFVIRYVNLALGEFWSRDLFRRSGGFGSFPLEQLRDIHSDGVDSLSDCSDSPDSE